MVLMDLSSAYGRTRMIDQGMGANQPMATYCAQGITAKSSTLETGPVC